ncbi:hypothetical protein SCLCIDRAFT_34399 [Scleroderma citrinum Foug A]|uniref:Uncharacterized protein n=1 Tax=Scleroderma citrinum Foug A TaxID=1036808 RepID=A0A0C3D1Q5_9AGAM|nr:hypothetical protein SCLCIDRAFT_34399 [Scleroderma citrinum Foug A]
MDEVTDALGVSDRSTNRWADNYEEFGHLEKPSVLHDLHELIRENPSLFLDEIDEWLAIYHDQPISTTAIHDNLRDLGLRLKVGGPDDTANRNSVTRVESMSPSFRSPSLLPSCRSQCFPPPFPRLTSSQLVRNELATRGTQDLDGIPLRYEYVAIPSADPYPLTGTLGSSISCAADVCVLFTTFGMFGTVSDAV